MTDHPLSAPEFYKIIRSRIEHENNLIAQRLSWFMTSQSFLFMAYALLEPEENGTMRNPRFALIVLLPVLAICTGVLIFFSIHAAVLAIRGLRQTYEQQIKLMGSTFLPIQSDTEVRRRGILAPIILPILFSAVWGYVLLVRMIF